MPAAHAGTLTGNPVAAAWQAGYSYTAGALVQPTSPTGQYFQCQQNGISAGSEPLWYTPIPVPGTIYPDNTTQWFCMGSLVAVDGANGPNIVVDIPIDADPPTTSVISRALTNLANYFNAFVALIHTWTATQTFSGTSGAAIVADPSSGHAISATGHDSNATILVNNSSTGDGIFVQSSGGIGVLSEVTGTYGVVGEVLSGTGVGVKGQGGSGGGDGVQGYGGASANGGTFTGGSGGYGILATGGSGGAIAVMAVGTDASQGVYATSANTDAIYAAAAITSGNGNGITAVGGGTGSGVNASGGSTGRGVLSESSSATLPSITAQNTSSGPGLVAESASGPSLVVNGNVTRGMIAATNPQGSDPSTPVEGDMYYNNTTHTWRFYNGSSWGTL